MVVFYVSSFDPVPLSYVSLNPFPSSLLFFLVCLPIQSLFFFERMSPPTHTYTKIQLLVTLLFLRGIGNRPAWRWYSVWSRRAGKPFKNISGGDLADRLGFVLRVSRSIHKTVLACKWRVARGFFLGGGLLLFWFVFALVEMRVHLSMFWLEPSLN